MYRGSKLRVRGHLEAITCRIDHISPNESWPCGTYHSPIAGRIQSRGEGPSEDGKTVQRITPPGSINTEPYFSPDGQSLYFTSDRGGSPQIYRASVGGYDAQRVTFEGNYNVSPRISPDGKTMAFITRREGGFRLAAMDLASRQVQILTDSYRDESPSFAPNSRMILIATEMGGRGVLSAVSIDGRIRQRLSIPAGDVREPAWGPYIK